MKVPWVSVAETSLHDPSWALVFVWPLGVGALPVLKHMKNGVRAAGFVRWHLAFMAENIENLGVRARAPKIYRVYGLGVQVRILCL